MINPANVLSLQDSLRALQERIAYSLSLSDASEHTVFVSVSVSDFRGNVLQTIDTTTPTSSRGAVAPDFDGLFAPGIPLNSPLRRIAAVSQAASYVSSLYNDSSVVISATFQDTRNTGTAFNNVVQCYFKDGKLVMKEVQVVDRS